MNPRIDIDPTDGRDETEDERDDRNWIEILQELRVIQTGTQILTGFLLTLTFQSRFDTLTQGQTAIYLVLLVAAICTTLLALSPVALHRALFRRRGKGRLVILANRMLKGTLFAVGLTLVGTALLVFDVVMGPLAGAVAGGGTLALGVLAWIVLPRVVRAKASAPEQEADAV